VSDRRIHVRAGAPTLRERAEGGMPTLVGHAAVFDVETTLFEGKRFRLREVVRRGAFARAIAASQDVTANMDHDDAILLGRTAPGTVRLREDDVGLAVEIDLPDTQHGRDVATLVRRGDLAGMSFAFRPAPGGEQRTIATLPDGRDDVFDELTDLDLYDVSAVARPAYRATDLAVRAAALEAAHRSKAREAWLAPRRRKLGALKARITK